MLIHSSIHLIDIGIVALYLLIVLSVGLYNSFKLKSAADYSSGMRRYRAFAIFASLTASYVGGGFTFGLAGKSYTYGIVFIFAMLGFSLKEYFIATVIAPRMRPFHATAETVGDIMEIGFGTTAKVLSGIAAVFVCAGIISAQFLAFGSLLNSFLEIKKGVGSLIITSMVVLYSSLGGVRSVVAADLVHFLIFIVVIPLILYFSIQHAGGLVSVMDTLHSDPAGQILLEPFGQIGPIYFILLFFNFFLGETMVPPYVQKLLIGKDVREISVGTLYSSLLSVGLFSVVGLIGIVTYTINSDLHVQNSVLPYIVGEAMPIGFKGLSIAAMLAIVMSSADSFLNATSITLKKDVLLPLGICTFVNPKTDLLASRMITLIVGVGALFISYSSESSMELLFQAYEFWTPFILFPLLAVVFGVRANLKVFLYSGLYSIITLIVCKYYFGLSLIDDPYGIRYSVFFALAANIIGFLIHLKRYRSKNTTFNVCVSASDSIIPR